jgi:hypothetical protein
MIEQNFWDSPTGEKMPLRSHYKRFGQIMLIVTIVALLVAGTQFSQNARAGSVKVPSSSDSQLEKSGSVNADNVLHLPVLFYNYPWASPFGAESYIPLVEGSEMLDNAVNLNMKWARLGTQISWRELQPNPGDPIQWHLLDSFEDELRGLRSAGITPIVVIRDSPHWAVIPNARLDGQPTSCGPIATEYFDDFANFLRQMVNRYKTTEFNVHDWELGNEPDVDPNLVPPDYGFGCWGDVTDLDYYGGMHYGEMLKVVTPVIRSEDPAVRVHVGGLLLSSPDTTSPGAGKPERFLRGILAAGAAPYFDILPYHWHPSYWNIYADYDNAANSPWDVLGGGTVGKARYLRQLMSEFGVDKPLFLNETGFGCIGPDERSDTPWCVPPIDPESEFFNNQADHLVRSYTRALSENVMGMIWYTLTGPGWRNSGLLDDSQNPRPAYDAYQVMIAQLQYARYQAPVDYGAGIEAYAFKRQLERVDVVWAINPAANIDVLIPDADFVAAYAQDGSLLTPPLNGADRQIEVKFSPVYIVRHP